MSCCLIELNWLKKRETSFEEMSQLEPSAQDYAALEEILDRKEPNDVIDLVFHYSPNGRVHRNGVRPFVQYLPERGLVTLYRKNGGEVLCEFHYIGKGAHRDCIKILVQQSSKAGVAMICKLVNGHDPGTIDDWNFLTECRDRGIVYANTPCPLAIFRSDKAIKAYDKSKPYCTVLLTSCGGPGINMNSVKRNAPQVQGTFALQKLWFEYLLWATDTLIEAEQKLDGMFTDVHDLNVVPCAWPLADLTQPYDFAVVDASGILKIAGGKGKKQIMS